MPGSPDIKELPQSGGHQRLERIDDQHLFIYSNYRVLPEFLTEGVSPTLSFWLQPPGFHPPKRFEGLLSAGLSSSRPIEMPITCDITPLLKLIHNHIYSDTIDLDVCVQVRPREYLT